MQARGESIHGEMDFLERCVAGRKVSILDAGCGTGRLAIEAVRRGHTAVGIDLDPDMIDRARAKAPDIEWHCADAASVDLTRRFDIVVMAGNVVVFCAPGSQGDILRALAAHVEPEGLLICGFTIENDVDSYTPANFRRDAEGAGLRVESLHGDWQGTPASGGEDYAVFVCRAQTITSR